MQQTQESDQTNSKNRLSNSTEQKITSRDKITHERAAVDEAKQLLSEITGVEQKQTSPVTALNIVKWVLLFPFYLLKFIANLIILLFAKLDLSLVHDMRRFLANPGNFFWFNRLAPDKAAKHFRTTSTDAMTHHVRRYGAHIAMLILAVVVVFGGGFGSFVKPIFSPDDAMAQGPSGSGMGVLYDGDMHLLYISTLGDPTANIPHRIQTYDVKTGDSLKKIAAANNIDIDTLLYANLMVDPDTTLKAGQKLVIPPVNGMLHIVNMGDTVEKIAAKYQVDPQVILNYAQNNLAGTDVDTLLKPGQEVMVPGGKMPARTTDFIYTVHSGDTFKSVADKFGISEDTIIWNNELDSDTLETGQKITILPVTGIEYSVKKNDTIQGIAIRYSASPASIINYPPNNLKDGATLQINTTIWIPDGIPPAPPPPTPTPVPPTPKPVVKVASSGNSSSGSSKASSSSSGSSKSSSGSSSSNKPSSSGSSKSSSSSSSSKSYSAPAPAKKATSYSAPVQSGKAPVGSYHLIWPIHGVITTYFHQPIWYGIHQGLDIATGYGTPCVAAASGVIVEAGWNPYGYGISVLINHQNGMETRYGHFSALAVHVGQYVVAGQVIGYEGSTGNSTGPHVHFEVHVNGVIVNPLNYLG